MALTSPSPRDGEASLGRPASEVCREGTRVVVTLRGEQDLSTAAGVTAALDEAMAEGEGDLVVDLSQVPFLDGAIVSLIARARGELRSRSRDLTLRGASPFARRVLALCVLL